MRYQHVDKKIPQRSVLLTPPYNVQIGNVGPSYRPKCGLSFFEVFTFFPACSFEARLGQWGHFMSHINGVANDGDRSHYWTILIGSERTSASTGMIIN